MQVVLRSTRVPVSNAINHGWLGFTFAFYSRFLRPSSPGHLPCMESLVSVGAPSYVVPMSVDMRAVKWRRSYYAYNIFRTVTADWVTNSIITENTMLGPVFWLYNHKMRTLTPWQISASLSFVLLVMLFTPSSNLPLVLSWLILVSGLHSGLPHTDPLRFYRISPSPSPKLITSVFHNPCPTSSLR